MKILIGPFSICSRVCFSTFDVTSQRLSQTPHIVRAKQTRLISPLDNRLLKLQLLIQSIFIISANFIFSTFGLGQRFSNFSVSNINPYILHALLRMPLGVQLLNGTSSFRPWELSTLYIVWDFVAIHKMCIIIQQTKKKLTNNWNLWSFLTPASMW